MPFDSLKGLREAYAERERVVVEKKDLSEDEAQELSRKFNEITRGILVRVVYFEKGDYIETSGMVSEIDTDKRTITIVQEKIRIDDIISIDIGE